MQKSRCLLVGCGGVSSAWLDALSQFEDVEISGLCDLDRAVAEARADRFGLRCRIDTDFAAALCAVEPEIVFDCTVPTAHPGIDIAAMESGADVLTEKPLASTMADAKRVVTTARATGKRHAVMQNRRFDAGLWRFKSFLDSGAIGAVHTLHADFFIGARFTGFRTAMEHPLLIDMAIHTFDAARHLLGSAPASCSCVEWNPPQSWYAGGGSATATFVMDDDSLFTYRGSWCSEGLNTMWESSWHAIGTEGSATWDGGTGFAGERPRGGDEVLRPVESIEVPEAGAPSHTGHGGCIREFLDARRDGRDPLTVSHDNIKSLAMSLGAVESAGFKKTYIIEV